MKIVSSRPVINGFERRILETLGNAALDGLATNNVVIPHVKFRSLPNEHDILVLTEGKVYTLDGKEFEPGFYRGSGGADWEYSREGQTWDPVTFMSHPQDVAFAKARVTESYLRERLAADKSVAIPQIISVIVVPDEADISGLGWGTSGTATGARILLTPLGGLVACLQADSGAHKQRRPTVEELANLFQVDQPSNVQTYPFYLSTDLRIDAYLGRFSRPVERELYRGFDEQLRKPVRIEVQNKYGGDDSVARRLRAFRSNLLVLQELQHDALLRVYARYDTPMALVVVTEFFSDRTLQDLIDERRLTWSEARMLLAPVVDLLRKAHAHSEKIVHRYLDPSCVLVQESNLGKVRVQGFFGAVVGGYSTIGETTAEDSNPYLAPERSDDSRRRDELQDAYSLGRCMCAMLTGDPFLVPPVGIVSAEVATAIEALTAQIPEQRCAAWNGLPETLSGRIQPAD